MPLAWAKRQRALWQQKASKSPSLTLIKRAGSAGAAEIGGIFCKVNITLDDEVDAAFAKARAAHGQEWVLMNCAGMGAIAKTVTRDKQTGTITHFSMVEFEKAIQINLIGTFRCIAKSAAGMLTLEGLEDGERGAIVNTGSVAAHDGQIGQAAYLASNGGIVGMTLPIARDLMNEGIRINTILPGLFATPPMLAAPEKVLQALAQSIPFPKRLGHPAEFASLAILMIENSYFNGEIVRLDGAIRLPPR